MKVDFSCEAARVELSARLDDEADASLADALATHLESCEECRRHERDLDRIRRAVRISPAEPVPDLADEIIARVRAERDREDRGAPWRRRARWAALGAAAAALVVGGASLPWRDTAETASAAQIRQRVVTAARAIERYRATFAIVERGWHPDLAERRFEARVWFEAPERARLEIDDVTAYPEGESWPTADALVIASPRRIWIRERSGCPVETVPGCSGRIHARSTQGRAPFDGATGIGTDVILPLETLASADEAEVVGESVLGERRAIGIALDYRLAVPLVSALEAGGPRRPFHPRDRLELWVDAETYFPLRFTVRASDAPARARWAERHFVTDRPGERLLEVETTAWGEPRRLAPSLFRAPRHDPGTPGGFTDMPPESVTAPWAPRKPDGLALHRGGATSSGATVIAYARGMTWLKATSQPRRGGTTFFPAARSEEVRLGAGWGYYRPAGASLRRAVEVFGPRTRVLLESNLPRAELLAVARSLPMRGRRLPRTIARSPGLLVERIVAADPYAAAEFATSPRYLPDGYRRPSNALLYRSGGHATLVVHYTRPEAEFDGIGIRITQSRAASLPPASGRFDRVRIHGVAARWSAERGELEWVRRGFYRAVAAPSFDLDTVLRIARGLR